MGGVTPVTRAVTENTDSVTYWRPWQDTTKGPIKTPVRDTPREAVRDTPRASFKHILPNVGRGGEGLEPHLMGGVGGVGGVGGYQHHQTTPVGPFYNITSLPPPPMPRLRDLLLTTITPVRRSELPFLYPTTSYVPTPTPGPPASRFVPFQGRQYVVRPAGSRISMKRRSTQIEPPPMQ